MGRPLSPDQSRRINRWSAGRGVGEGGDLRDVYVRGGRQAEAATHIARLREEHTKKPSLIDRFRKAGLTSYIGPVMTVRWADVDLERSY